MKLSLMTGLALLALATAPGGLIAQSATSQLIAPSPTTLVTAAQLRLPATQAVGPDRPVGAGMIQQAGNRRQGEILMIVGVAGIVTGLVAHEDLITIAGAGVGGFGLYRYLQATH